MPTPPILCLRFAVSLAVAAQDSRPSGSLLLSRKALSSSTSCRFSPAHCNGDISPTIGTVSGLPTIPQVGVCRSTLRRFYGYPASNFDKYCKLRPLRSLVPSQVAFHHDRCHKIRVSYVLGM